MENLCELLEDNTSYSARPVRMEVLCLLVAVLCKEKVYVLLSGSPREFRCTQRRLSIYDTLSPVRSSWETGAARGRLDEGSGEQVL